jgi:hypothetical protein
MRSGCWGAAFVALLLVACTETRNAPTPGEMCRVLSEVCGTETDATIQCANVGQTGLKDPSAESRCYAVYDDCLPICQFPTLADAGLSTDAGSSASAEKGGDGGIPAASASELSSTAEPLQSSSAVIASDAGDPTAVPASSSSAAAVPDAG